MKYFICVRTKGRRWSHKQNKENLSVMKNVVGTYLKSERKNSFGYREVSVLLLTYLKISSYALFYVKMI